MPSKSIRAVPFFVAAICLAFAYSIVNAQAQVPTDKTRPAVVQREAIAGNNVPSVAIGVIYSQPPSPGGGLFPSSRNPAGTDYDQYVWDNFTLQASPGITITEVRWRGGYQSGSGTVLTFTVAIYPSIAGGSQPDVTNPPLEQYQPVGNAGETLAGTVGGIAMYDYHFTLPTAFQATAGTKYWVQIEAFQNGIPDWGLAVGTGGDNKHFRGMAVVGDIHYDAPAGDTAFTLLGPVTGSPIANAGQSQAVKSKALVTLDGSGSYDPDNDLPLSYGWLQTGGEAVILSSTVISRPTFTAPGAIAQSRVLTFSLVVTDTMNLASAPAEVAVLVEPYRCFLPLVLRQ